MLPVLLIRSPCNDPSEAAEAVCKARKAANEAFLYGKEEEAQIDVEERLDHLDAALKILEIVLERKDLSIKTRFELRDIMAVLQRERDPPPPLSPGHTEIVDPYE